MRDGPKTLRDRGDTSDSPSHRPRIAIVVTCHNDGPTLGETIASIRNEPGVEFVVVDDGSKDPVTLRLLSKCEQDGARVIRQSNQGQAAAAMTGFRATSAPYVMRFDSDDVLEQGVLPALADALDASPEAAAAWGDVQTFGVTSFRIPSVPALDPWLVTYVNCVTGSGNLIRRTALEKAGGWRLEEGFEDWDLWMSLAERGYSGTYVPRVVFRIVATEAVDWPAGMQRRSETTRSSVGDTRPYSRRGTRTGDAHPLPRLSSSRWLASRLCPAYRGSRRSNSASCSLACSGMAASV